MDHSTLLGIDYPTLWFLVVGGLFSGYAILDGFDLGAGAWHLFFRKEEAARQGADGERLAGQPAPLRCAVCGGGAF